MSDTLIPKIFKDRLTTTDDLGHRVRVIPAKVKGRFQRAKDQVHLVLIGFFLALPWLSIRGAPLLQLNVPERKFFLFGHLFLPQDVPGIFFVVATFALSLFFISAIWGRVWCGWACPQTVFIEGFFRRVERLIEGDHLKQRELDREPWGARKISIKTVKWLVFFLGAAVITHSFLALFVGGENVMHMMVRSPRENPGSFAVVMVSTLIVLFDFGWFREQFCLIACPYGRFQSVMMDDQSVTIAYDSKRGEPRKMLKPEAGAVPTQVGDCINCLKCIRVCPTGIDIRNGFQMECIACTACADVCDEVMLKIGKPVGLVRYASEAELRGEKQKILRPRVLLYGALLGLMLAGLSYRIASQETYQTEILRAVDTPYQVVKEPDGRTMVINHFKVNWYNLSAKKAQVELQISQSAKEAGIELIQPQNSFQVNSAEHARNQFFLKFPVHFLNSASPKVKVNSHWQTADGDRSDFSEVTVVGPDQRL